MKLNEKTFNTILKKINKTSEQLARDIHDAGMFAIFQANQFGNVGFAERLMEAIGRKHDAQRVAKWLVKYGKIAIVKNKVTYRNAKDINPETFDAVLAEAEATPYWELTPKTNVTVSLDILSRLEAILHSVENMHKKQSEGKDVVIEHEEILPDVKALIEKFKANPALVTANTGLEATAA